MPQFRYNANRAALVQSRIKALEKLEVVEPPEDLSAFTFHLPVPEPLGRPVINIQRVTFGYPKRDPAAAKAAPATPTAEGEEDGGSEANGNGEVQPEAAAAPKQPVEIGRILFSDVDFGIDLDTRIGEEGGGKGRKRMWETGGARQDGDDWR